MALSNRSHTTQTNQLLAIDNPSIATSDIQYRFAGMQDIPAISTLMIKAYKQTYSVILNYYTDDVLEKLFGKEFRDKTLPGELNDIQYQFILCEKDTQLAGYAKLEFKENVVYLDKLYFLNEYQGKGYGQQLMKICYQSAYNHGYNEMKLLVWDKNEKAINFYKRSGFKKDKTIPFLLFGNIPTNESNLEMTCKDITPYVKTRSANN